MNVFTEAWFWFVVAGLFATVAAVWWWTERRAHARALLDPLGPARFIPTPMHAVDGVPELGERVQFRGKPASDDANAVLERMRAHVRERDVSALIAPDSEPRSMPSWPNSKPRSMPSWPTPPTKRSFPPPPKTDPAPPPRGVVADAADDPWADGDDALTTVVEGVLLGVVLNELCEDKPDKPRESGFEGGGGGFEGGGASGGWSEGDAGRKNDE